MHKTSKEVSDFFMQLHAASCRHPASSRRLMLLQLQLLLQPAAGLQLSKTTPVTLLYGFLGAG